MQFSDIFAEYYTLFRGDSDIPLTTDPEWAIAVRYGNTALRHLQEVDGEDWEWLWTTASTGGNSYTWGTPTLQTFSCPTDMQRPGGWIKFTDPVTAGNFRVDVIGAYQVQRMTDNQPFAWYTGDPQNGFTLHVNLTGNTYKNYIVDFPYYKKITLLKAGNGSYGGVAESGSTVTECPDSNYLINYILAYRYRSTRNYPSYQTAKKDAEICLQGMQIKNRKGVDGHPFNLDDTSSGSFGF